MKPPAFSYHVPATVDEALGLLGTLENARLLAGGQSLIPMLNMRFAFPDHLIDLNRIEALAGIAQAGTWLRIGAMTRQRDLEHSTLVRTRLPLMAEALTHVGHRQTRNRGTIGGSLCHLDPVAELVSVAAALDAEVEIAGPAGRRTLPFAAFPLGYMTPAIAPEEMMTALLIDLPPAGHGHAFVEFARRHGDFAIVSVAVLLQLDDNNRIASARITLGGVEAVPLHMAEAEALLIGRAPGTDLFGAAAALCRSVKAMEDPHVPAWYRQQLAVALTLREHANLWGLFRLGYVLGSRDEGELVAKLVWRVKLVTELEAGETMEVEVARLERDEQAGLADLGLRLAEAKQLMAAIQAEIVPAQVTVAGEHRRTCAACDGVLASKGHYTATFRSLFGDVPIRVRRLLTCPCQGTGEAKSFAAFDLEAATVAPELAYVTARYAALAPFGKVADLLSELLPISGAQNAGTVRNRTMRAGEAVVQPHAANTAKAAAQPAKPVVIGLDGGYVRSRHRQDERHFEVIAGKVIDAQGRQSRFAFARNSPTIASEAFKQALSIAGVTADTPAMVLSDGDAGLWRLQRESLPNATVVLDWWHAAVRFEHALQAARGLGAADTHLSCEAVHGLERAKWRLWHGRWSGCRRKLAALCRWAHRTDVQDVAGIGRLEHHVGELLAYLERNQGALVHYAARRRNGEPISTAFVESSVNEIIAKRMNKKQQMRWNRATVQPFLDVRTTVLNDTLADAFRHRYPGFRPVNDDEAIALAA